MKNTFLNQVTNDLIQRAGGIEHLGDYTIVFPMQRAGLFMQEQLREHLLQQTQSKTVLMPCFTTIDALTDSLCALQPDDEIRSVVQLYHIFVEETGKSLPFDVFYTWGRQLLTDFSNVDMALLNPADLFQNSVDAHNLEQLNIDDETLDRLRQLFLPRERDKIADSIREEFEALWQVIPRVYSRFHQEQETAEIGYRGARTRWVVEHFSDEALQRKLQYRRFAFVGFNYLLRGEKQLMRLLQQHAPESTLFYWDNRPDFATNAKAYAFIQQHISDGFQNALPASCVPDEAPKPVEMVVSSTTAGQVQYVQHWLRENHKEGQQTAIVIADESMLEPVLFALPADLLQEEKDIEGRSIPKVNITKGFPLRSTKVFAEALRYLQDRAHDKQQGETYADVLNRLLQYLEASVHPKLTKIIDPDTDKTDTVNVTWQQDLLCESYYQTQLVIRRLVQLIEDGTLQEVTQLHTLCAIVRRVLEGITIPFHGKPIAPIQVIGVLETRLLDFDNVLILNVEEGVLPRVPADNSFIPYYLRKMYGMQTAEEEASIYAYNFFRMLRRPEKVSLLFSDSTSGTNVRGMSRFMMQMLTSPSEFTATKIRVYENRQNRMIAPIEVVPDMTLLDRDREKSCISLSPSAINAYLQCPRRFYLEHVRGLRKVENTEQLMERNTTGSLVHAAVQAAYLIMTNDLSYHDITPSMITSFLTDSSLMEQALDKAFEILNKDYENRLKRSGLFRPGDEQHYLCSQHVIETEVARRYMAKVLKNDAKQPFSILSMEKDYRMDLPVFLDDGTLHTVRIGGSIDRLDCLVEEGRERLRILDYKTGSFSDKKMRAEQVGALFKPQTDKQYMLQTLLYCMVIDRLQTGGKLQVATTIKPIAPSLLFISKNLNEFNPHLKFGRGTAAEDILDYANWDGKSQFEEQLTDLVRTILSDSEFPLCPEQHCRAYCPFLNLCNRKPATH